MQGGTAQAFATQAMAGLLMCKRVERTETVTTNGRGEHVPAAGVAAAEQPSSSSSASASASPFSVYTPIGQRSDGPMILYQYWKTRAETQENRNVFLALRDQRAILRGEWVEKKVHYGPFPGVHPRWPQEEGEELRDADDKVACAIPLAWARAGVASVPLMQDVMTQLQHNGAAPADTEVYGSQENWLDLFNVLVPKYMWFSSQKFQGWEAPMDVRAQAQLCARDRGRFLQTCKAAANAGVPTTNIFSLLVSAGLTDLIGREVPEHFLNVDLTRSLEPKSCYFQSASVRHLPGRGTWDIGCWEHLEPRPKLQQHWLPFFRPLFGPARVLRAANGETVWEGLYPPTLVSELGRPSGSNGSETAGVSDF
ncbi:unnamed protein product [Amoebophrya sp. A120]|nr:unnamed protein product [Amoebophrya sp. A120]|eukprot:GSA120T00001286001.1